MAKTVKRKINIRGVLVILLIIYLIGMFLYYLINLPIKNIEINGTSLVSDLEIIEVAGIKKYPSLYKINTRKVKNKIKDLPLVKDVKIRKNIFGKITFDIEEDKILFLNRNTDKIVLASGKEIENKSEYLGVPVLINYVPEDILKEFIEELKEIDSDIISLISEIEYSKEELESVTINEKRFLLRMNDTNSVYVDTVNLEKLNGYSKFYATVDENVHGIFLLDSNHNNVSFTSYASLEEENQNEE